MKVKIRISVLPNIVEKKQEKIPFCYCLQLTFVIYPFVTSMQCIFLRTLDSFTYLSGKPKVANISHIKCVSAFWTTNMNTILCV